MENKKTKKNQPSTICSPQLLISSVYLGRRFMVKNNGDRKQNFTRLLTEWISLKRYKYSEPIKYGLHLNYRLCWVGEQCLRRWTSRTKFYEALFIWKILKRYKKYKGLVKYALHLRYQLYQVSGDGHHEQNFTRLLFKWKFSKRYKYKELVKYALHLHYQLYQVSGGCLRRWTTRTKIRRASLHMKISKRYKYKGPVKYALHLRYRLCQVSGECLRRWTSRTKLYNALSLSLSTHENSRTQSPRQSRSRRALKVQIERKLSDTLLFEGAISVNLKGEIRGGRRGGSRVQKCEGSLDVDDTTKLQDVDGSNAHETHDTKHAHANDHRLLRKTHLLLVQPAMKNPKPPACHKWSALENSSAAMKDRVSFQVPGMVKSRVIGEFRVSEIHFEKLMGVFPKHPSHRQKSPWICAIT